MRLNTLLAAAVAAAFAFPLAAQASADSDRMILAQAGGPGGASQEGTGPTGGTPSPRTAGEPKAAAGEISSTATNERCKDLKGMERDNCLRDSRASSGAATGGATVAPSTPAGAVVTPGGSSQTGTTAGPDSASNRTAPSSDTATSPSTSGQGKPQ